MLRSASPTPGERGSSILVLCCYGRIWQDKVYRGVKNTTDGTARTHSRYGVNIEELGGGPDSGLDRGGVAVAAGAVDSQDTVGSAVGHAGCGFAGCSTPWAGAWLAGAGAGAGFAGAGLGASAFCTDPLGRVRGRRRCTAPP